ncbi:MAG: UPF0149 family protein [Pseudomonadota bacterium]
MAQQQGSDFERIEQLLASCEIDVSAPEADGRLLSLATMLGGDAVAVWLQELRQDSQTGGVPAALSELARAGTERIAMLEQSGGLPDLCLPDDDDDIRDRVDGLVAWATGFLSGLGEASALRGTVARERLKAEPLAELIEDLTQITRAEVDVTELADDPESAESAYFEVVEFLRVLAQLSYEELLPLREVESAPGVH